MYLNDPEDASSVKNNIKYAKLKSNVSLSLSLMSELKKSFLRSHQLWKHQADVNSSNVGSFNNPRQLKLQIMLPACHYWNIAGQAADLGSHHCCCYFLSQPCRPIRDGTVSTIQARSPPWGENDACLVSKLGLITGYLHHHHPCQYILCTNITNIHNRECKTVEICFSISNNLYNRHEYCLEFSISSCKTKQPTKFKQPSTDKIIWYYGVFRLTGILSGQQNRHNFNPIPGLSYTWGLSNSVLLKSHVTSVD